MSLGNWEDEISEEAESEELPYGTGFPLCRIRGTMYTASLRAAWFHIP